MSRLFVYGILMPEYGDVWESYFPHADGLGDAVLEDYSLYLGSIARMFPNEGGHVEGFLFDLGESFNWRPLDALETGYERVTVTVEEAPAYAYVVPKGAWPTLVGVSYLDYLGGSNDLLRL